MPTTLVTAPPGYDERPVEGLPGVYCTQHTDPGEVEVTQWPCDQHGPAAAIGDPE